MKISHTTIIAIMLIVIAVAFAGCSGSGSPAATTGSTTPPSGSTASSSTSGSDTSSASLFSSLNYNWVEYKIDTGSGASAMTIYYKYTKEGKCTMRFEGAAAADMPAQMQEMDCSSIPGSTEDNIDPNYVSSDAQVSCSALPETVIVPAGSFSATKCTITSPEGDTATSWVVKDKFMVKMESSSDKASVTMVLNTYG